MVYHIMKDGTIKTDLTGYVVKVKDAEPIYNLMRNMNKKRPKRRDKEVVCAS